MNKIHARRLRYLADKMAKLPKSAEKHFDMRTWFRHRGRHGHKFGDFLQLKDLTFCGTSACAMGWAASMPYFNKLGLSIKVFDGSHSKNKTGSITKVPEDIFGNMAGDLFYDFSIKTPKEWAAKARAFLRQEA